MIIERKNINRNLPKKGFKKVKSGHHIYFHHYLNDVATGAYTYISHSKKSTSSYSGYLLKSVRRQLQLDSNQDVVDLINCPMDGEQYNEILRQKGLIP